LWDVLELGIDAPINNRRERNAFIDVPCARSRPVQKCLVQMCCRAPIPWTLVLWAFALALASLAGGPASAQSSPTNSLQEFTIPSQPLDAALSRYGDITGREALYDTSLAAGRVSGAVQGVLTPDEALKGLLLGTDLSAQFVAKDAFVLLATPPTSERPTIATSSADRRYYAFIQENLLDALCRSRGARPGQYRFVAMFWIGPDGSVERSRRIGSTGSADADQQIDTTLRSVRFSEPPPARFAQPVLIQILPQAQGVTLGCTKADSAVGSDGVP
jgi:hypothetical protein